LYWLVFLYDKKILETGNFVKKISLAHNSGGSRSWHWHWLKAGEGLMMDGVTVGVCKGARDHMVREEA
jgi:hypothetical protein